VVNPVLAGGACTSSVGSGPSSFTALPIAGCCTHVADATSHHYGHRSAPPDTERGFGNPAVGEAERPSSIEVSTRFDRRTPLPRPGVSLNLVCRVTSRLQRSTSTRRSPQDSSPAACRSLSLERYGRSCTASSESTDPPRQAQQDQSGAPKPPARVSLCAVGRCRHNAPSTEQMNPEVRSISTARETSVKRSQLATVMSQISFGLMTSPVD
jgi:hypothetical protein